MRIGPFGVWEIMIILIVVLLIFGPRRLPEMAKGLGQSVRAFRKEMRDIKADLDVTADLDDDVRPGAQGAPQAKHAEGQPAPAQPAPAQPAPTQDAGASAPAKRDNGDGSPA